MTKETYCKTIHIAWSSEIPETEPLLKKIIQTVIERDRPRRR